jgi:hypothetical protein
LTNISQHQEHNLEPYLTIPPIQSQFTDSKKEYLHRITNEELSLINKKISSNYMNNYEKRTYNWKQWVGFMIPIGLKNESLLQNIHDSIKNIYDIKGIEHFPLSYCYLPIAFIGYLKPDDVMWSQVESFYANASPRIHRISPFEIESLTVSYNNETVYLSINDNYNFREIRKQLKIGVPHIRKIFTENDNQVISDIDYFMPKVDLGYFSNTELSNIKKTLANTKIITQKITIDKVYLVRMASDPQINFPDPDIIAEIPLIGPDYRTGYRN